VACGFLCDTMFTDIHCYRLLDSDVASEVIFSFICYTTRRFRIYCCTPYTNCTYSSEFSVAAPRRVRYGSMDQVYSTLVAKIPYIAVTSYEKLFGCSGSLYIRVSSNLVAPERTASTSAKTYPLHISICR
jgi:hypothetical protein